MSHPLRTARAARLACVAGLSFSSVTFAQSILLRTGTVDTDRLPSLLSRDVARRTAARPGLRAVIQFDGPISDHQRALLKQAGVRLGDYLPEFAYLADLSAADRAKLADLGFVRWAGEWQDAWKIEPEIGSRTFEAADRRAIAQAGDVLVQAYLFDGENPQDARAELNTLPGVTVQDATRIADMDTLVIRLPLARLDALAQSPAVRFVEELPELTDRSNANTQWIVQSNVSGSKPLYNAGIHGEGQVVGIIDSGFQPSHCSFVDPLVPITTANTPGTFPTHRKVVAYNVTLTSAQHGTHVAGTAMGNQSPGVDDNTRGIAYEAKVAFRTYSSPIASFPIDTHLTTHAGQGARVHTNSWGDDGTTAYNAICRAIDLFSYNNEDNLVCFACTNLTALKNPENAKNVLAVGKSGGSGSQTGSCSTLVGPTADGRRKPEVFAPGCSTISSNSSSLPCGTTSLTGTSMASPAVAGAATLVRQYFTDGFYPTGAKVPANSIVPSGALLRAMLVNSAVDMTAYPSPNQLPPNNNEGFGRILLDNAVYFAGDARKLIVQDVRNTAAAALASGSTSTTLVQVSSSAEPLRITMAFSDAPATVPTSFAPVNNINLRITDPAGNIYLGNVFNTATGFSQTGGAADAINSIEHAAFNAPSVGQWRIEVTGAAVNVGKQGFGLVITGRVATVVPCPADLTGDQFVDDADFVLFSSAYDAFDCVGQPVGCPADFNRDGFVDDADFVVFSTAYDLFACPA
ncbi:MAG: S8 family serine peptidase [Phycisphaerales bacterium]